MSNGDRKRTQRYSLPISLVGGHPVFDCLQFEQRFSIDGDAAPAAGYPAGAHIESGE